MFTVSVQKLWGKTNEIIGRSIYWSEGRLSRVQIGFNFKKQIFNLLLINDLTNHARKDQMWAFIDDQFYKLFNLSFGGDVTESNAVLAKE